MMVVIYGSRNSIYDQGSIKIRDWIMKYAWLRVYLHPSISIVDQGVLRAPFYGVGRNYVMQNYVMKMHNLISINDLHSCDFFLLSTLYF